MSSFIIEKQKKLLKASKIIFEQIKNLGLQNVNKHKVKFFTVQNISSENPKLEYNELIGTFISIVAMVYINEKGPLMRKFCLDILTYLIKEKNKNVIINEVTWFQPVLSLAFKNLRFHQDKGIFKLLSPCLFQLDFNKHKFYDASFALWIESYNMMNLKTAGAKKKSEEFVIRLLNHGANPSSSFYQIERKNVLIEDYFENTLKVEKVLLEAEEPVIFETIYNNISDEAVSHIIRIYYTVDDTIQSTNKPVLRTSKQKITNLVATLFGMWAKGFINEVRFRGYLDLINIYDDNNIVDEIMEETNMGNNSFGYTDEYEIKSESDEGSFDNDYGFGASSDEYDYDDY